MIGKGVRCWFDCAQLTSPVFSFIPVFLTVSVTYIALVEQIKLVFDGAISLLLICKVRL
jgi:hypothetical protein